MTAPNIFAMTATSSRKSGRGPHAVETRCGGPARRAVQNVEGQRFMSKVSGSRFGIVVVVQRNDKNTCALETVVCNVRSRKVGRRYSAQKLFIM